MSMGSLKRRQDEVKGKGTQRSQQQSDAPFLSASKLCFKSWAALAAQTQTDNQHNMSQFTCFMMPNYSFPTLYYLTVPNNLTNDPTLPETITQINSLQQITSPPIADRLQLSREELLAAGYERKKRLWTAQEDQKLMDLVSVQNVSWRQIQQFMVGRTQKMCYSRYRRLLAQARQRWAPEQEKKLKDLVQEKGQFWKQFASLFPHRTWKQLRDKYINYLRPSINRDQWSLEEDMKILELLAKHGTKWKSIQQQMPNRTDNQIKNRYYGRLKILLKRKARRKSKKIHS